GLPRDQGEDDETDEDQSGAERVTPGPPPRRHQPLSSSSAIRLTSAASTWPLWVFMMSPTSRPTCLGSAMPSVCRRSRTSACTDASSSPLGRYPSHSAISERSCVAW